MINGREVLRVKMHRLERGLGRERSKNQCGLTLEALREMAEEGPEQRRNAREGVPKAQGTTRGGKEKGGRGLPKPSESERVCGSGG